MAQMVFPIGERAGQVKKLHRHPPQRCRWMPPHQVAPFEHQQTAEQYEQNERQMKQHQPIGGDSVQHGDAPGRVDQSLHGTRPGLGYRGG
ncbi:hypothetical protein D9M71_812350 [compost metagenome]